MFKKMSLFFALLCTVTQYASALKPWVELKPSYFLFATSPMHDIYHKGGFEIQGSASLPVYCCVDVYGSIGYRKLHGHALNTGEKTSLMVMPVDMGIKPVFTFCDRFYSFFAFGPRFFYFHQRNDSPYVSPSVTGGGVGFFINAGCNATVYKHLLLGVFGEYSYEKKTITSNIPTVFSNGSTQLGGFAFGASVGYDF